jgi:glutathione S-transferase
VICDYLDEVEPPRLHPTDPLARAQHRAWIEFASATLNNIGAFYNAADEAALVRQRIALANKFETLEVQFSKHNGPYFAGVGFSLVDAAFAPVFRYFEVFDAIRDFGCFANAPRVSAWRATPFCQRSGIAGLSGKMRVFLRKRNSALSRLMDVADQGVG